MTPASFTQAALNDMKEAYEFYEAQSHGLALKFMLSVRQAVDQIEKAPLRFPVAFESSRKARVAKFPFVVYYVTDGESIIIACLHSKRDGPKILLERLRTLGPGLS